MANDVPVDSTGRIYKGPAGTRHRLILQKRKHEAGTVVRVPDPEIERLVIDAIRAHVGSGNTPLPETDDRDLVEQHLESISVKPGAIDVQLKDTAAPPRSIDHSNDPDGELTGAGAVTLSLPNVIASLLSGAAPASLTVTGLANGLPYSGREQKHYRR